MNQILFRTKPCLFSLSIKFIMINSDEILSLMLIDITRMKWLIVAEYKNVVSAFTRFLSYFSSSACLIALPKMHRTLPPTSSINQALWPFGQLQSSHAAHTEKIPSLVSFQVADVPTYPIISALNLLRSKIPYKTIALTLLIMSLAPCSSPKRHNK